MGNRRQVGSNFSRALLHERASRSPPRGQHLCPGSSGFERRPRRSKKNALGRSRGGITTKIHAAVDQAGRPHSLAVSASTLHDVRVAIPILGRRRPRAYVADRAYDSKALRKRLRSRGIKPVIPGRANRLAPIRFDKRLYRKRFNVECFFHQLKRWRKVATRFEKRAGTFLSVVLVAAIGILTK